MSGREKLDVFLPQIQNLDKSSMDSTHGMSLDVSMGLSILNPEISAEIKHGKPIKNSINQNSSNTQPNLPIVFLSNIQSFGRSGNKDKSSEIDEILNLNAVDIAVCTETWLCKNTVDHLPFSNYVKFHFI